ncbi:TPR-like protein, partial [Ceratobasidium sp. AG-I]
PARLLYLSQLLLKRATILDSVTDFDSAIECLTRAAQVIGEDLILRVRVLNSLALAHKRRFMRYGATADINAAIEYQYQTIRSAGDKHEQYAIFTAELGSLLMRRHKALGGSDDLRKSIECQTWALTFVSESDDNQTTLLNNLGSAHLCQFERLGELEDINKAISCLTQAVRLTSEGHPDKPSGFGNLGSTYVRRFERLGDLEDISRAIACHREAAVQLAPEAHPDTPNQYTNLGNSYLRRYERLENVDDVNMTVQLLTSALSLTPETHPNLPIMLNTLGNAYSCRVKHGVDSGDLNNAVQCSLQAVNITSDDHADKPGWLQGLGNQMRMRFSYLKKTEDNESGIAAYTLALHLLPQTHVQTPILQSALARSYRARLTYSSNLEDIATAMNLYEAAAHSCTGLPSDRFEAAREWAGLLSVRGLSSSLPAHHISMQLLYEVVWLGTTSARRYERVTEVGAVAVEAAAAAISAQEYNLALEWLEAGRSIVWNQTLQLRTPVDTLTKVNPELGLKLQQVCSDLERASRRISNPSHIGANTMASEQDTLQHHRLVAQYNALISQARGLSGFEDYMRTKKVADLMPVVRSGPVVVINVHRERCDALVLRPQTIDVEHVPLPKLSYKDIGELQVKMRQSLGSRSLRDRKPHIRRRGFGDPFEQVLIDLWHNLVKPVLEHLGYTLPIEQLPHITWCTTGALSFLPIHAAGDYGSGEERIYDYAITSYTPTLSALLPSASSSPGHESGVLTVSQESTHGLPPLPGTKQELAAIQKHIGDLPHRQLENIEATPAAVLAAMEKYECVHLACHASQNVVLPTKSCFHLHGGTLSLEKIAQRSLKNKGLAFLSACQTAMGDEKMPDESIHLAAGMLVAGYPSVIATMWSIDDLDAPVVADHVYGQLIDGGKMDWSRAARALHVAVGVLREKVNEKEFTRWVPYVHIGA